MISLLDAMEDEQLFKPWVSGESWDRWRVFLKSLFALPMGKKDLEIYRHHTGRMSKPRDPARKAWLICGRRSGKSFITALVAVYLACFRSYAQYLGPGEVATIPLLAADRKQARVLMRYVKGLLEGVPFLANMISSVKAESIDLDNAVCLEIHTASYSSVRGYTIPSALCDEISFWSSEDSASPDVEIVSALRPAMATIPGSLLPFAYPAPIRVVGPSGARLRPITAGMVTLRWSGGHRVGR